MSETQTTIREWREATFGRSPHSIQTYARTLQEFAELLPKVIQWFHSIDNGPEVADEIADVVILLYGLADHVGADLHAAIDRKMAINRRRKWGPVVRGHAQHVGKRRRKKP